MKFSVFVFLIAVAGFLIGVILWKFQYADDKTDENEKFDGWSEGYSFWLAVGATGSSGIALILMVIAAVAHKKK